MAGTPRPATRITTRVAIALVVCALLVTGCAGPDRAARPVAGESTAASSGPPSAAPSASARAAPDPSVVPGTTARRRPRPRTPLASDGRPRTALLSIPTLGVRDLEVVPYRGRTDDAPGTRIQNAGTAASPHGPHGGTGPGGLGNYQVTGHRLSSTMPFRYLPSLEHGAEVHVEAGGARYVYRIVATRRTSFRDPASLAAQRAAVPGRPGVEPSRAMITLSTCATIEDHAAGNFWSDEHGNPEHRIDKIGVLVRVAAQ